MRITSYRSSPDAFYVNSHLIELDQSVIVVDTQFVLPEAENLLREVKRIGKPVVAIFLTHPHPDHVNGTAVLLREWPKAKVYATETTANAIREIAEPKRQQWKPLLGDAYPDSVVLPDVMLGSGGTVTIEGTTFRFEDMGPMESINESLIYVDGHDLIFAGDLFYNKVHPWMVEGRSVPWRAQLVALLPHLSESVTLYVGHGEPATREDLKAQIAYMDYFFDRIKEGDSQTNGETFRQHVLSSVKGRYPNWPLEMLIEMNLGAVAEELRDA
ncbi:MAG: MBL fold metallo-hydrolase [Fibrella sp.]|nr:MBL fold metallo-hydrolase [Armatimonadota bacterium]